MALQGNFVYNGVTIPNAYIKVELINMNKSNINVTVVWRASAGSTPLQNQNFGFPYNISGNNPIAQAYIALKALPEFSSTADC